MAIGKKILVFGGAFNPPHLGHLHILKKAIEFIKPDETLVCVDKVSPWKQNCDLIPYSFRLQMVNNLFRGNVEYFIYKNENNLSFTCDILHEIAQANPESEIYLLVGQDQYESITQWNNYDDINKLSTIVCYKRGNKPVKRIFEGHIILPEPVVDYSSSATRIRPDAKDIGELNYQFINEKYLYLQSKIKPYMSERRYQHTLRVLDTITKIANGNKFSDTDIWRCQIAALLHDIAKQYTDEQLLTIMTKEEIESFPTYHCAHGLAGARLAKKDFNIADEVILEAIDNHVIFKKTALENKIAKALFCADKLEPARTEADIPNRALVFDQCCHDLNATFTEVLKQNESKY